MNGHWVVGYQPSSDMHPGEWCYTDAAGAPQSMTVPHRVVVNTVESYLASGELVEVLGDWPAPPMPVSALYVHRMQRSRRIVVFIDWFQALLGRALAMG